MEELLKQVVALLTDMRDMMREQKGMAERMNKRAANTAQGLEAILKILPPEARKHMEPIFAAMGREKDGK